MNTTYVQKNSTVQKIADSNAASILDPSAQSESLQRKADMANNAAQRAEAPRPNNTGMPDNLKSGIESLSGFSMDDVRVHYNSSKPATVQALAYTQGTDIHVAPGQEKHLPHEAWHVAQQMAGRVSPTTNINGMPVNDNASLEHEADVMGEKAVGQRRIDNKDLFKKNNSFSISTVQMINPKPSSLKDILTLDINPLYIKTFYNSGNDTELDTTDNKHLYYFILNNHSKAHKFVESIVAKGIEKITNMVDPLCKRINSFCKEINPSCESLKSDELKDMLDKISSSSTSSGGINNNDLYLFFYNIIQQKLPTYIPKVVSETESNKTYYNDKENSKKSIEYEAIHKKYSNLFNQIAEASSQIEDDNVKNTFFTTKNIDVIIGKFFSASTGANLKDAIIRYCFIEEGISETIINSMLEKINETLKDIAYWKKKLGYKKIKSISLTDSDAHMRGVGVCIIEFSGGLFKTNPKYVIKPENKGLEEKIYGKGEKSLAKSFGKLDIGPIGTLDIQVSDKNGSLVEFFEHYDLEKEKGTPIGKELKEHVDITALTSLIHFSSLLGLRDLHHENLVYSHSNKNGTYLPQLIDAEIAMWFLDEIGFKENEDPLFHSIEYGEIAGGKAVPDNLINIVKKMKGKEVSFYIKFLEDTKTVLQDCTSRVVLIPTGKLYSFRNFAYHGKFNKNSIETDDQNEAPMSYVDFLKDRLYARTGINITLETKEDTIIEKTKQTFLRGEIPFYEYIFKTGEIIQVDPDGPIPLYKNENLILDNVIKKRLLLLDQHSK